jgi:hypothetical protein
MSAIFSSTALLLASNDWNAAYLFLKHNLRAVDLAGARRAGRQVYTYGGHVFGKLPASFDYNVEMALQSGHDVRDSIGAWAGTILWVPIHVAALIAGMCAVILAQSARGKSHSRQFVVLAVAGLGFASALGLSTWQNIFFCEFDGPRNQREIVVTVINGD